MRYKETVKAVVYHFQEILEMKKFSFSFDFIFKIIYLVEVGKFGELDAIFVSRMASFSDFFSRNA